MLGNVPEVLFWVRFLNKIKSFCASFAWRGRCFGSNSWASGLESLLYVWAVLVQASFEWTCGPIKTYSMNLVCVRGCGRDTDPDRLKTALQESLVPPSKCLQGRLHFPGHHWPSSMRLAESKRKIHFHRQSSLSATAQILWESYWGRSICLSSPPLRRSESWNDEVTSHNLIKSSQPRSGILAHAFNRTNQAEAGGPLWVQGQADLYSGYKPEARWQLEIKTT